MSPWQLEQTGSALAAILISNEEGALTALDVRIAHMCEELLAELGSGSSSSSGGGSGGGCAMSDDTRRKLRGLTCIVHGLIECR
jgi:hypothetical protein